MDSASNCDDILFHVLKECKTLPSFLDAVFGFLKRRTDFFVTSSQQQSAVGMPPQFAENLVQHTFYKWQGDMSNKESTPNCLADTSKSKSTTNLVSPTSTENNSILPGSFNGAIRDKYMWSQNINELVITIDLPENVLSSKLNVQINMQHICIKCSDETILDAKMPYKIKHTSALWSVDQNTRKLEIHLDKMCEIWWDRLFLDEEPLDISKLDCSRPYDELPQEAQAMIEELQWNQERKRMGLLTSQQQRMQTMLQNSWQVEGSPFRGSFDPTTVDFDQQ